MEQPARPSALALLWKAREVLLAKPEWLDYVRRVYRIDPGDHPFLSYVGVNFTADSLKNYKLYFSFFRRLAPEEIAQLLPVPDRGFFDRYYAEWHPSRDYKAMHRGTTFALKIEADGTLTHYYHLRLRGLPCGPPERLPLAAVDRDNYHGVCEEFTAGRRHLKRYYYLRDPATIRRTLEEEGLPGEVQVDLLEYIESEGRDKLDWITADPALVRALLARGQPRLISGLQRICHDCDFELFGPGTARGGGDQAIYFIQTDGPLYPAGCTFDGVRRFITRHLKLPRFLEP